MALPAKLAAYLGVTRPYRFERAIPTMVALAALLAVAVAVLWFAAAAGGVGVGLVPRSVLEVFPQHGVLSVREIPSRLARVQTALIMLRNKHQPALARLEECLREDAAKQRTMSERGRRSAATRA